MPYPDSIAPTETTYDFALAASTEPLLEALSKYPAKNLDWRIKLKANLDTIYEYNGFSSFPGNQLAILTEEGDLIINCVRPQCKQDVLDKLRELSRANPAWEYKITDAEIAVISEVIAAETAAAKKQAGGVVSLPASLPPADDISASLEEILAAGAPTPAGDVLSQAATDAAFSQIASEAEPELTGDDTVTPLRASAAPMSTGMHFRRTVSAPAGAAASRATLFYRGPIVAAPALVPESGLGAGRR
jgi:hypothetical protein